TVLITGCSEGRIGSAASALTFTFHRHGCRVFATAQNLEKVHHLTKAGIEVLELDVLDAVSCKKAAEWVSKVEGGTLNVLVNTSGICELRSWNGYMRLTSRHHPHSSTFCPFLIAAASKPRSEGGMNDRQHRKHCRICPVPRGSIYNASKAAVNNLTDTLRFEMEPLGVKVILVGASLDTSKSYL
ncbi:hypothetical protein F5882DRAFT_300811, partial [Hyaloscypha sp. PMI_1271]